MIQIAMGFVVMWMLVHTMLRMMQMLMVSVVM